MNSTHRTEGGGEGEGERAPLADHQVPWRKVAFPT
jgi:hypothetical protein